MPAKNPNKPSKAKKHTIIVPNDILKTKKNVVIPDEKLQDFATSYTIDPSTALAHAISKPMFFSPVCGPQNWNIPKENKIGPGGDYVDFDDGIEKEIEKAFGKPFDEVSVSVGKDNENAKKPKTPEDICKIINESFRHSSDNLHFFFTRYDRYTHRYFCQQYISGLPHFILTACNNKYGWDIALNAIWTAHKTKTLLDWDKVATHSAYNASLPIGGMMQIPSVRSISYYEWGFEILSHGGYSAFGIMKYALTSDNFCHAMTEFKEWALPIEKRFQLTKPLAKWSELTPEETAELNKQLDCLPQSQSKCNMNVGQRKVQLDLAE